MPTQVRIERPDGSTENPVHVASSHTQKFGEMDMATIDIPRSKGVSYDLQEDEDEVFLSEGGTDFFGGVLRDTESKESTMELVVDGWETLAADARRTPPGQRRENVTDGSVVSEAIAATPRLSEGTVSDVETGLTLVFASASQARKARQTEEAGEGELRYNADLTVDYLDRLGSDKSGSVVISPDNQNTDGGVEVKKNTRVRRATHLVALGAGEGNHQRYANVVPNDDPATYDNEVRYDAGTHWEPGDRKKWDTVSNKDATSQSAVEAVGRAAAREIREKHITVTAVIKGVDVSLGDTVKVEKDRDNIDRPLRVVRRRRLDDSEGGLRYECDLSNRRKFDKSPSDRGRADTERYNRAFEGTPVTMTTGGGRQPVNGSLNYEFDFYYPDEVAYEHRVKLFVKGLAYRAYSRGAASGGDHTHSFDYIATGAHSHNITEADFDHTHLLTASTSADSHGHPDGTLTGDSHGHPEGTLDADDHDHADGTLDADDHDHDDGSFDADDHDHPNNITEESNADIRGGASSIETAGTEFGNDFNKITFDLPYISGDAAWAIVLVNFLHDETSDSGTVFPEIQMYNRDQSNEFYQQSVDGFDPGEGKTVIGINQGDVAGDEIAITTTTDSNTDFSVNASSYVMGTHTHNTDITQDSGFDQPGVTGDSGFTQPQVTGNVAFTQPGVSGDTGDTGPGVTGDTGNTGPDVAGGTQTPGETSTTETETETESSVTTTGNKDHTHPPEAGVIESFGGTVHFPGNCEVLVNGSPVGVSLGDGTGTFEQEVDLAGELNPGRVNTVEVTSDSLGHVQAHLDVDVYRQILGDG